MSLPCRRHELQFINIAEINISAVSLIQAPLPSPCCAGLLPQLALPGTHCPVHAEQGLANSVLAQLWLAQSQLKRSLYASHFLSFAIINFNQILSALQ